MLAYGLLFMTSLSVYSTSLSKGDSDSTMLTIILLLSSIYLSILTYASSKEFISNEIYKTYINSNSSKNKWKYS